MADNANGRLPWPKKYIDQTGRFTYYFSNIPGDGDDAILCLEDDEPQFSTRDGAYGEFVVPAEVDGYPVEIVDGVLIPNCCTLRFEDGIRVINLEGIPKGEFLELILPKTLEKLAEFSFAGCGSLERAVIPAGRIGRRAFANCRNLRALELGPGVREIRGEAFRNCIALQSVELPDGLIRLGNRPGMDSEGGDMYDLGAFDGCANLRRVRIGASLREVEGEPFTNCPRLMEVEVSPENRALEARGARLVRRAKPLAGPK